MILSAGDDTQPNWGSIQRCPCLSPLSPSLATRMLPFASSVQQCRLLPRRHTPMAGGGGWMRRTEACLWRHLYKILSHRFPCGDFTCRQHDGATGRCGPRQSPMDTSSASFLTLMSVSHGNLCTESRRWFLLNCLLLPQRTTRNRAEAVRLDPVHGGVDMALI